jgi:hypothetical protein
MYNLKNAQLELEKIEFENNYIENEWTKNWRIWIDIADWINYTEGDEQIFWENVMDLYHKKYSKEIN